MNRGRKYYFLTIAETLNITRAAEQLHVSQPSLTQYVNHLEQELGIQLIDRRFTPLRLTNAGKIYCDYLRMSEELDDKLDFAIETIKKEGDRPLVIGLPLQKSHDVTKVVLPGFIVQHPDINITISEGTSQTVRKRVVSGELELGFSHTLTVDDPDCSVVPLTREKIAVICSRDCPLPVGRGSTPSHFEKVSPELLNELLFFQMPKNYFLYEVEAAEMKKYGVSPARRIIMSNLNSIIDAVIDNPQSFAFMPDYLFKEIHPMSVADRLMYLTLGDEDFIWDFSMIKKRDHKLSRPAQMFWNCVLDYRLKD